MQPALLRGVSLRVRLISINPEILIYASCVDESLHTGLLLRTVANFPPLEQNVIGNDLSDWPDKGNNTATLSWEPSPVVHQERIWPILRLPPIHRSAAKSRRWSIDQMPWPFKRVYENRYSRSRLAQ